MARILFTNTVPLTKYCLQSGFKQFNSLDETRILNLMEYPANERPSVLYNEIKNWKPQIVFAEGFPGWNIIECMAPAKRDLGHTFRFYYWSIEDGVNELQTLPVAKLADHVFTTVVELLPFYKENGISASLMLFATNPEFHRPTASKPEYDCDICLIAANYDRRYKKVYPLLIEPIIKRGYSFKTWGPFWDDATREYNLLKYPGIYQGTRMAYEEMPFAYSSCKIALGVNQVWSSTTQTSMRVYEIMGCGAFHLGYHTPALETLFEKGVHMEWTKSPEETIEIIDKYLADDKLRNKVASEGRKYVLRNHSYAIRVKHIWDIYNSQANDASAELDRKQTTPTEG